MLLRKQSPTIMTKAQYLHCLNKEQVNAAEEIVTNQYNKSAISPLSDQRTSQHCWGNSHQPTWQKHDNTPMSEQRTSWQQSPTIMTKHINTPLSEQRTSQHHWANTHQPLWWKYISTVWTKHKSILLRKQSPTIMTKVQYFHRLNKEQVNATEETVTNQYDESTISLPSEQRPSQCCWGNSHQPLWRKYNISTMWIKNKSTLTINQEITTNHYDESAIMLHCLNKD